ncbi:MAG: flavodoxin [Lachnospiraceae bacterium]|jgi:flavodoxin
MRKSWKALVSIILAGGLLAGCGSSAASGTTAGTSGASSAATTAASTSGTTAASSQTETTVAGSSSTSSGNVLVVYYSASGNTEAVAQTIADAVGADIFEITPVEEYTSEDLDWTNEDSRVSREHEDESLQDEVELVTTTPDNWDSYDTVFVGYPIWWGNAAWPVNQFIQNNDFTGKTVIPFCTSASSGIGSSGTNLAEMAGTGDWQEGQRFAEHPDESDVTDWATSVLQ